ncbi:MAG TPA: hypothetical protein VIJ10_02030 [Vicinamibacteria bacterium]|jgi:hypothetical protein
MKRLPSAGAVTLAAVAALALATPAAAQFEKLAGKPFDSAYVRDFYLEGNSIPTQKRNTVMLKDQAGKRLVFSLLDTTGYSAEIQAKYIGMLIFERPVTLGDARIPAGAYGFGLRKGQTPESAATLLVYDVGGAKVGETAAAHDAAIERPVPLQVVTKDAASRLYAGRHWVQVQ